MALTDFSVRDEGAISKSFNDALDASLAHALDMANSTGIQFTSSTASLSGPGAVPITASIAEITTTGADAMTLADGAEGQHLYVVMIVDGGDATLTPANAGGWTTITFADAGDSAHLLFTNGSWYLVGQGGLTTGPLTA